MAFSRREKRYEILRKNGFLIFEAKELSKMPLNVPYFKDMVRERNRIRKQAVDKKWSREKFENSIRQLYTDKKYTKTDPWTLKTKYDPWKLLREWEDDYRGKNPDYIAPWQKRQQKWQNSRNKIENTLKLQKGMHFD